jgi:predicted ATPase
VELADRTGGSVDRYSGYYGLWVGALTRGEPGPVREIAERFLREIEAQPGAPEAVVGHRILGVTHFFSGDFVAAHRHFQQALQLYDHQRHRDLAVRFGQDPGAGARIFAALSLWVMGRIDEATKIADLAVAEAQSTAHVPTMVYVRVFNALLGVLRGDRDAGVADCQAFADLVSQHDLPALWLAQRMFFQGWIKWHRGEHEAGIDGMRKGSGMLREQHHVLLRSFFEPILAEAEAEASDSAALTRIDEAIIEAGQTGHRQYEAESHRIRGEILLKRDPANTASAEEAFLTAIAVAREQKARSFELRAALSLAKLYQSSKRAADAHAVLATALEGFAPTPEFPEIEEAQALLAALAKTDEVKNADASRKRRLQLQVSLANAMLQSRGQHATETKAAFDRARELAGSIDDPLQRFSTYYGLWVGGYVRGEKATMTEAAESLLKESDGRPDSAEAGIAHRIYGVTCWMARGDLSAARDHLEKAVALHHPQRDSELAHRFAQDVGVAARAYLSIVQWVLGECDRSRAVLTEMMALAAETKHAPTLVYAHYHAAFYETIRLDPIRTKVHAETCLALARERGLEVWTLLAPPMLAWANANLGRTEADWEEMRRRLADARQRDVRLSEVTGRPLLAAGQAEVGQTEAALATVDQAIAEAQQSGICSFDPESDRIRGEILLKLDPANPVPAEQAFRTAIAIAQQQKARSFGLRAALSLAKLYQLTGRDGEAHAVLASALEGFSLTPEFPEIEQAQTLLAALAETDEVKNAAASRQRRLKLQTSLGQALIWSKGFGSEDTKAAFNRAQELAAEIRDAAERFSAHYGLFVGDLLRGELGTARETAEIFVREAEAASSMTEVAVARRCMGMICLRLGQFNAAQENLEQSLRAYDPERDREAKFRFGMDSGASATAYLAHTNWQLGDVRRARELIEDAVRRAAASDHVPTLANTYHFKAILEILRGDAAAALFGADAAVELSRQYGLPLYQAEGTLLSGFARARLANLDSGIVELRQAFATFTEQGNKLWVPLYQGLLAETEAEAGGWNDALSRIDAALAIADVTAEHWTDAFLHRIRGEILLKRDPANTALAEDAFLTAIAVAQQQKARSFELRAALPLAKLYQSTNRPADAHTVLAQALEGFSPTPEFPEIEEAQTLLAALAETDEVKIAAARRKQQLNLQISLGNALIATRGYGAPETQAAFVKARELAGGVENPIERYVIYYGLFIGSLIRGEPGGSREIAERFLQETASKPGTGEFGVAHRLAGLLHYFGGDYVAARRHFETALGAFDTERDRDFALRYGQDPAAATELFLGLTLFALGDVERARHFAELAVEHALRAGYVNTVVYVHTWKGMFEMARRDIERTVAHADASLAIAKEHGLDLWLAYATALRGWATFRSGDRKTGLQGLHEGLAQFRKQKIRMLLPFLLSLAAETEMEAEVAQSGLSTIEAAIAEAAETGEHQYLAESHRIRGEILLKRDAADTAPAEEAFLTAIAVARRQKARSFELRAALSLAKLYQSTNRPADAHTVLAPALEGFAPTPEFPEIEAAQALLAALRS